MLKKKAKIILVGLFETKRNKSTINTLINNHVIQNTNKMTIDSSIMTHCPNKHLTSSSRENTEYDSFSKNIQKKKSRNQPKCTLWKNNFNGSIYPSTLYNMTKTDHSSVHLGIVNDSLTKKKITITKIMPSLNKARRIDHFINLKMKKKIMNRSNNLALNSNAITSKKVDFIHCSLTFWKGVIDASLPIILTDKFVQYQKNAHKSSIK